MKWAPEDSRPLTTERRITVVNSEGAEGWMAVGWNNQVPRVYGPVHSWVDDRIIDPAPTFVSQQSALSS